MSASIITIANQKGSVGKTITTVNLAASLASRNKCVLVIDLDPQGGATTGNDINRASISYGVYQVVLGEAEIKDTVIRSDSGRFGVLAANRVLAGVEVGLVQEIAREVRLENALKAVEDDYDFILIDCPPSLTLLALNGSVVANGVIVPMLYEYYVLEGISDPIVTVRKIRQAIDPNSEVLGIVRTMYDARSRLIAEVGDQLQQHFGGLLLDTTIPRNIRLVETPSHGMPALAYDASARGARVYLELADELLGRLNRPTWFSKSRGARQIDAVPESYHYRPEAV